MQREGDWGIPQNLEHQEYTVNRQMTQVEPSHSESLTVYHPRSFTVR